MTTVALIVGYCVLGACAAVAVLIAVASAVALALRHLGAYSQLVEYAQNRQLFRRWMDVYYRGIDWHQGRVRVSVELVRWLDSKTADVNLTPFRNIDWTENGEVVPVPPERAREFAESGMPNTEFVMLELYKPAEESRP